MITLCLKNLFLRSVALCLAMLMVAPLHAEPALALGYTPAYPPSFSHFNYVNPDAPKGGSLGMSAFGSFDSLNPFLLKGLPAAGLGGLVFETLLEKSWITPIAGEQDSRKKEYEITALGRSIIESELLRLQELVETGKRIAGGRTL